MLREVSARAGSGRAFRSKFYRSRAPRARGSTPTSLRPGRARPDVRARARCTRWAAGVRIAARHGQALDVRFRLTFPCWAPRARGSTPTSPLAGSRASGRAYECSLPEVGRGRAHRSARHATHPSTRVANRRGRRTHAGPSPPHRSMPHDRARTPAARALGPLARAGTRRVAPTAPADHAPPCATAMVFYQFAKLAGATVIGTTSTESKAAALARLGCTTTLSSPHLKLFQELVAPRRVLETVWAK